MQSPLVTTAWLHNRLGDENLRIIDIRGKVLPPSEPPPHYFSDREGYETAHIPGAAFVDWQVDIVEPGSPSNDIASPSRFAELMSGLGVDSSTEVIIYDDAAGMFAARMRWCLLHYGHERTRILDGGWQKWLDEDRPRSSDPPQFKRANFRPVTQPALKANGDDILAGLQSRSIQLIDVRSPAEYAGETSRARRGGHIPSAINLPRNTMVADDLTLKSPAQLRRQFAQLGINLDAPDTVLYCNSGVSACYGMLALEVAGADNLRIYDGSWKEWGSDSSKPISRSDH